MHEDFGANLRKLRDRAGLTQANLAERVGVRQASISQYEKGRHLPSREMIQRLDEALGGQNTLLNYAQPEVAAPAEMFLPPSVTEVPVTPSYIQKIHSSIAHFVELDGQNGGKDLLPMASRLFTQAARKLESCPDRLLKDFAAATAELGEVAGWLAFDAVENDLANRLNTQALHIASKVAKDAKLSLFILGNQALLNDESGRPKASMEMVKRMQGAYRLSPRMRAMTWMRQSRAAASLGNEKAVGMILRAQSALEDGVRNDDPEWSWWINLPEMKIHEAGVHRALGNMPLAIERYWEGREAVPEDYRWGRLLWTGHLVSGLAAVGDWRQAEQVAGEAVRLSGEVFSMRGATVLKRAASDVAANGGPEELKMSLAAAAAATGGR